MTTSDSCISPFDTRSIVPLEAFEIDGQERLVAHRPEFSDGIRVASPDAGFERGEGDSGEGGVEFLVGGPIVDVPEMSLGGLERRDEEHVVYLRQRFTKPVRGTEMGWMSPGKDGEWGTLP